MKSTTVVSALIIGAVALNVVQFDIYRVRDSASRLAKRATIDSLLDNQIGQYNINLTIGTPPQSFSLQLDTGSSDLWVNTATSDFCSGDPSNCTGGLYDSSASSSYQVSTPGGFNISYVDNSGASGDYSLETVMLGGVTILNQTFGVANVSTIPAGLIGVAFPDNEAICNSPTIGPCTKVYPSIIDNMVIQGKINTRAYSLWLDDLNASTGSILFGGLDTSKYEGDLTVLDIIPEYSNATFTQYKNFNVIWSNLTIEGVDNFWYESNDTIAILDSGTSLTYVPPDIYDILSDAFDVSGEDGGFSLDCSLGQTNITFDFTFGGSDGATISVAISEFVLDNGDGTCRFGIRPSTEDACLLGDTFLRSAYVVYDLENKIIGIAQTNFDGGAPNIQEISGDIPNASATASTVPPPAATSALATFSAIGPVTATGSVTASQTGHMPPSGTVSSPPSTYTGAGVTIRAGSKYMLGCVGIVLGVFMAL